jgi:hypothetical protein
VLNCEWAPGEHRSQRRTAQQATYLELMKALLDKGADRREAAQEGSGSGYNSDLSGVDEIGATPFWRAAYASDVPAMRLLVSAPIQPSRR